MYCCRRKSEQKKYSTPTYESADGVVTWKNEVFRVGSGVLLEPEVYDFNKTNCENGYELVRKFY